MGRTACLGRGRLLWRGLRLATARWECVTARGRARGRLWAEGGSTLLGRSLPLPTYLAWMVHGLLRRRHGPGMPWSSHRSCAAHGLLLRRWGKPAMRLGRWRCSMGTHGSCATGTRRRRARPAPVFTRRSVLVGPHILSVPFAVVPVATPIFPATIHDDVGGLDVDVSGRRVLPVAGHPVPPVAAPVPVATNPEIVRARCHGDELLLGWRRRARHEDGRLFFHDHRGLGLVFGLGRWWLVVDRLWFRRRRSNRDRGANHAA